MHVFLNALVVSKVKLFTLIQKAVLSLIVWWTLPDQLSLIAIKSLSLKVEVL